MAWFGHGMALAYIRLDLGAAAGQEKRRRPVQIWWNQTGLYQGKHQTFTL
ncbi:hypothetical protein [Salinibacillus aidingensis]